MYVRIDGKPFLRYPVEPKINQILTTPSGFRQVKEVVIDPEHGVIQIRTEPYETTTKDQSAKRGQSKGKPLPEVRS